MNSDRKTRVILSLHITIDNRRKRQFTDKTEPSGDKIISIVLLQFTIVVEKNNVKEMEEWKKKLHRNRLNSSHVTSCHF